MFLIIDHLCSQKQKFNTSRQRQINTAWELGYEQRRVIFSVIRF